jgi:hypothetical protein
MLGPAAAETGLQHCLGGNEAYIIHQPGKQNGDLVNRWRGINLVPARLDEEAGTARRRRFSITFPAASDSQEGTVHGEKRLIAKKFPEERLRSNRGGPGQLSYRDQPGAAWGLRFSVGKTVQTDRE